MARTWSSEAITFIFATIVNGYFLILIAQKKKPIYVQKVGLKVLVIILNEGSRI